ncbi:MAG: dethiobiotin synthase [Burkholderiales bacterium]|nr:dethiobiotin synthase [Burkholderiales bacterium]
MTERPVSARGVFVAGTDTGVGKTLVACALLRGFAARGLRVAGMKPVAAGAVRRRGVWHNDDVAQLRAAANVGAPLAAVNPYCFAPPVAPHIAAQEARAAIRMSVIEKSYARLGRNADLVVVEGVGGLLVPLGRRLNAVAIPLRLDLPVVLVVGLRLGCLNHALLTVEALQARGIRLAGWIANRIDPAMARAAENLQALRTRIKAPLLGTIRHTQNPQPAAISRMLDIGRLQQRLRIPPDARG